MPNIGKIIEESKNFAALPEGRRRRFASCTDRTSHRSSTSRKNDEFTRKITFSRYMNDSTHRRVELGLFINSFNVVNMQESISNGTCSNAYISFWYYKKDGGWTRELQVEIRFSENRPELKERQEKRYMNFIKDWLRGPVDNAAFSEECNNSEKMHSLPGCCARMMKHFSYDKRNNVVSNNKITVGGMSFTQRFVYVNEQRVGLVEVLGLVNVSDDGIVTRDNTRQSKNVTFLMRVRYVDDDGNYELRLVVYDGERYCCAATTEASPRSVFCLIDDELPLNEVDKNFIDKSVLSFVEHHSS